MANRRWNGQQTPYTIYTCSIEMVSSLICSLHCTLYTHMTWKTYTYIYTDCMWNFLEISIN